MRPSRSEDSPTCSGLTTRQALGLGQAGGDEAEQRDQDVESK